MSSDRLSATFAALADPTRRAILARLLRGEASVIELAEPFKMSLPAISKHLKVLERAGLITRTRDAQWRPCRLKAGPLKDVADWVEHYRDFWEQSFDRLDDYLREVKAKEKRHGRKRDSSVTKSAERGLVITRVFDAPRELVWRAWTEPAHAMRWWGPKGFTAPVIKIDLRVGGKYLYCMRSPDGKDYWSTGVYREIVPMERLVMTDSFADADGNVVPASHYGMPGDWPRELLVTVTFEDDGGKTKMTLQHVGLPEGEMSEQAGAGWNESFDKLAEELAKA